MAFTIDEIALKNAVEAAQLKMNDILYAFKGNFTTIENLSDIKYNFIDKAGKLYDSTKTYSIGDIITYDFYAYVSVVDNNLNNNPYLNPTYWIKVETNTCLIGDVFVAAFGQIYFPFNFHVSNTTISGSYMPSLQNSHNISYMSYLGGRTWEIKFNDSLALSDSNYIVLIGATNFGSNTFSNSVGSSINIISKSKTGFIFKLPESSDTVYSYSYFKSFAIVPLQNEDFTI